MKNESAKDDDSYNSSEEDAKMMAENDNVFQ